MWKKDKLKVKNILVTIFYLMRMLIHAFNDSIFNSVNTSSAASVSFCAVPQRLNSPCFLIAHCVPVSS